MKLTKTIYKVIIARLFNKTIPLVVYFSVTNSCNLNCDYCLNKSNTKKDILIEDYKKIIDMLAKNGTVKLTLFGGEPLLRKDIKEMIIYAKERIPYVFIDTNGLLFNSKKSYIRHLDSICFSVNQAHEKKYYKKLFNNIRASKKFNSCVFMSCVLNKSSIDNLDEILEFSRNEGVGIYFSPIIDSINPKYPKLDGVVRRIIDAKKKGYPVIHSLTFLENLLRPEKNPRCFSGKLAFFINTDGALVPCVSFIGTEKYNLLDESFDFDKVKFKINCRHCFWNCSQELNYLLSFKPRAIINVLKSSYIRECIL